jgi:hypothetical protein
MNTAAVEAGEWCHAQKGEKNDLDGTVLAKKTIALICVQNALVTFMSCFLTYLRDWAAACPFAYRRA